MESWEAEIEDELDDLEISDLEDGDLDSEDGLCSSCLFICVVLFMAVLVRCRDRGTDCR